MQKKDGNFKKFNNEREKFIKDFDYIKLYDIAREYHYAVIDALYKFYSRHDKDIVLFNKPRKIGTAISFKTLDLSKKDIFNFYMKNAIYYGYYKDKRIIDYINAGNKRMDVDYLRMLHSVEKCFCSIFKVISANPLLAIIEIKDVLTGKEYFVVERGLSAYANNDEFKNGFYICSTLTIFKGISFFDNTVLIDQDNPLVIDFISKKKRGLTSVEISYFAYLQKTERIILDRETRE